MISDQTHSPLCGLLYSVSCLGVLTEGLCAILSLLLTHGGWHTVAWFTDRRQSQPEGIDMYLPGTAEAKLDLIQLIDQHILLLKKYFSVEKVGNVTISNLVCEGLLLRCTLLNDKHTLIKQGHIRNQSFKVIVAKQFALCIHTVHVYLKFAVPPLHCAFHTHVFRRMVRF